LGEEEEEEKLIDEGLDRRLGIPSGGPVNGLLEHESALALHVFEMPRHDPMLVRVQNT